MSRRQASSGRLSQRVTIEEEDDDEVEVEEEEEEEDDDFIDNDSEEENNSKKRKRGGRSSQSQSQQTRKPIAPNSSQSSQAISREEAQQLSNEEIENIVNDFVRYILYSDRKKIPILKSEITKNVLSRFSKEKRLVQNVFQRGINKLSNVFGYELKELPKRNKESTQSYILVNNREVLKSRIELDKIMEKARINDNAIQNKEERILNQNLSLITIILGIILIEGGNAIDQVTLFQFLSILGIREGEKHEIFGEWEKLIEKFSKELYLTRTKITLSENNQPSWSYSYGPRAFNETSKRSILYLISNLYGCEPDTILLKQIQIEEEKLGIAPPPEELLQQQRGRQQQQQQQQQDEEEVEEQQQTQRSQRGGRRPNLIEEEEEEEDQPRRGRRNTTTTTTTTTTTMSSQRRR